MPSIIRLDLLISRLELLIITLSHGLAVVGLFQVALHPGIRLMLGFGLISSLVIQVRRVLQIPATSAKQVYIGTHSSLLITNNGPVQINLQKVVYRSQWLTLLDFRRTLIANKKRRWSGGKFRLVILADSLSQSQSRALRAFLGIF